MTNWVICNTIHTDLLWSNDLGWIEGIADATVFTDEEHNRLNLPIDGEWRKQND